MSFDDPTSLWQRVAKPVVAITAVLAALTGIFALIWPSSAAFLAAVVVVVLLALSGAAWLASPTPGTTYRLGLSQRVRTSIAVAAALLTVTGAVWAWLQIVNRDLTRLAINDIRFSSTGDRMIVDVSLGAAEPIVVNKLILSEYWLEIEACGGHSYEDISLGPVAQSSVVSEDGVTITLDQINDRSGGQIQTSGERTWVGSCHLRSSVTVHPQAGIDGGGHAGISVSIPESLKIQGTTTHELYGDIPDEYKYRIGDDKPLFTDPNTKRDSTWDGYRGFFVAQASDDHGHCTRRVEEIFPEITTDASPEAATDVLDEYASNVSGSAFWVEDCPN